MSENLFESIKKVDKNGREFWMAREFAKVLGYEKFTNFELAIVKAKTSIHNQGHKIVDHVADVGEMIRGRKLEFLLYFDRIMV